MMMNDELTWPLAQMEYSIMELEIYGGLLLLLKLVDVGGTIIFLAHFQIKSDNLIIHNYNIYCNGNRPYINH
jgi:hypothetical protein